MRCVKTPTIFVAHGAPPLLDDPRWMSELNAWAHALPTPKAVLMLSAHWEERPITLGATTTVPLVYDFYGFPKRYYEQRYPAPGAPGLAERIHKTLEPVERVVDEPTPGSITARTSHLWRCTRRQMFQPCRRRFRAWSQQSCLPLVGNSRRCAMRA